MKTPELEKMAKIADESQKIGEFLNWLQDEENNITLCQYDEDESYETDTEAYVPVTGSIETLLAKYFDIDLAKCEKERQGLLDELRANNG